jgi:hypothetical protein
MFSRAALGIVLVACFLTPSSARPSDKGSQGGATSGSTVPLPTVVTESKPISPAIRVTAPATTFQSWADDYNNNRWEELQTSIITTLDQCSEGGLTIDFSSSDYYVVSFLGRGPNAAKDDLISVVVHTNGPTYSVRPYSTILPGTNHVFQLFINDQSSIDLDSYYSSTRVPNPLINQAIKAAQTVKLGGGPPAAALERVVLGKSRSCFSSTSEAATLVAHVSTVILPERRASISVQSRLKGTATASPQAADATPQQHSYSLTNNPKVWYSLSSIAGAVLEPGRRNKQYKLQSGKLTESPLSVTAAIIGLNLFPWSRSNDTSALTWPQRIRVVPGLAVSPALAPSVGGAFLFVDGFSLNAGVAWFRVNKLAPGETAGNTPQHGKGLRLGSERLAYVGLGYNFN